VTMSGVFDRLIARGTGRQPIRLCAESRLTGRPDPIVPRGA
jgi:hypothetical protein